MGDEEKFEYIYKFVTRDRFDAKNPARTATSSITARCTARASTPTAKGEWLPLVHDENGPLNSRAGFANQGDIVIKVRAAADLLGATPMDRPRTWNRATSPAASTFPAPRARIAA
jgi:secreted PhoX family phosphatase